MKEMLAMALALVFGVGATVPASGERPDLDDMKAPQAAPSDRGDATNAAPKAPAVVSAPDAAPVVPLPPVAPVPPVAPAPPAPPPPVAPAFTVRTEPPAPARVVTEDPVRPEPAKRAARARRARAEHVTAIPAEDAALECCATDPVVETVIAVADDASEDGNRSKRAGKARGAWILGGDSDVRLLSIERDGAKAKKGGKVVFKSEVEEVEEDQGGPHGVHVFSLGDGKGRMKVEKGGAIGVFRARGEEEEHEEEDVQVFSLGGGEGGALRFRVLGGGDHDEDGDEDEEEEHEVRVYSLGSEGSGVYSFRVQACDDDRDDDDCACDTCCSSKCCDGGCCDEDDDARPRGSVVWDVHGNRLVPRSARARVIHRPHGSRVFFVRPGVRARAPHVHRERVRAGGGGRYLFVPRLHPRVLVHIDGTELDSEALAELEADLSDVCEELADDYLEELREELEEIDESDLAELEVDLRDLTDEFVDDLEFEVAELTGETLDDLGLSEDAVIVDVDVADLAALSRRAVDALAVIQDGDESFGGVEVGLLEEVESEEEAVEEELRELIDELRSEIERLKADLRALQKELDVNVFSATF